MFAQLNTKTEYSFLDSVVRVDDYLNMAEKWAINSSVFVMSEIYMVLITLRLKHKRETYSPLLGLSLFLRWTVYLYPLVLLLKILRGIKIFKNLFQS